MAPQPRFFIVRPDTKRAAADGRLYTVPGPIVPLVAVDELPAWLDIADVPRELSVEQTIGLCNLGTASKSKGAYAVKIIHHATPAARQSAAVKGTEAKQDSAATVANAAPPSPGPTAPSSAEHKAPATATAVSAAHPADRMRAHWSEAHARDTGIAASMHNPQKPGASTSTTSNITTASPNSNNSGSSNRDNPATTTTTTTTATLPGTLVTLPGAIPTTATGPNPGSVSANPNPAPETEYCRHWCAYGTCKWGLHCRYLHAMPTTPRELAEVGLREIPAWWVATAAGLLQQQQQHVRSHHHHHRRRRHGYQQYQGNGGYQQQPQPQQQHQQRGNGGYQQQHQGNGHANNQLNHLNQHFGLGAGAGMGGNPVGGPVFDPRDVRAGVIRRVGMLPHSGGLGVGVGGGVAAGGAGGAGGHNKKAMKAQLRETVALLSELGLGVGVGNINNGKARRREVNPLEKGRGKGVDKEAVLRAARGEFAAAGDGAGGQAQSAPVVVPGPVLEKAVEVGKEGGQGAVVGGQAVAAQKMGKLVDV